MSALRSVRGRVAVLAVAAVALVLAVVGTVVVATFARREADRLDERLAARPPLALGRALGVEPAGGPPGEPGEPLEGGPGGRREGGPGGRLERRHGERPGPGRRPEARVLRPQGEFVRLVAGGAVVESVDVPPGLPPPQGTGLRTVEAEGGRRYRTLTRAAPGGLLIEVGADLEPVADRVGELRTRVIALSAAGVAAVGALAWWLAGVALRPLGGLRAGAARVSTTADLSTRLESDRGLEEIDALSDSINAMLGRLERSAGETEQALEATRRFAADVGHELRTPLTALRANLGALARNPDAPGGERRDALEQAEHEAERTVRLLDALQTLARGDAAAALPREPVDLADVAELALERARRTHPDTRFALAAEGDTGLGGWPDGLAVMAGNLIENAARHGGSRVEVRVGRDGDTVELTVDDDGPGIPAADRERIFGRFVRGRGAAAGSGLGLALVRQQARLHGGDAHVEDSPLGGARVRVRLAAT